MIRHVVSWKLIEEEPDARAAVQAEIQSRLAELRGPIPEILSLEVGLNVAYPESNWDVVLIADYASLDTLEAYQVHPAHQEFAGWLRPQVAKRSNVDFEL